MLSGDQHACLLLFLMYTCKLAWAIAAKLQDDYTSQGSCYSSFLLGLQHHHQALLAVLVLLLHAPLLHSMKVSSANCSGKQQQDGSDDDAHPDSCAAGCMPVQHLLHNCLAVRHHHSLPVLTCQTPAASIEPCRQETAGWQTCKRHRCTASLSKLVGGSSMHPLSLHLQ